MAAPKAAKATVTASIAALVALLEKIPAVVTSGQTTEANSALAQLMADIAVGDIAVLTADGAVSTSTKTTKLAKTSAIAATLAAPTAAQEGQTIKLIASTAFAHVVTATGLIDDGVTGGSKTTLTFGAFVGSSITLQASDLKWVVLSQNVCVIT